MSVKNKTKERRSPHRPRGSQAFRSAPPPRMPASGDIQKRHVTLLSRLSCIRDKRKKDEFGHPELKLANLAVPKASIVLSQ